MSWGKVVDALEALGEMALIRKTGLIGHGGDGVSCKKELLCLFFSLRVEA